MLSLKKCNNTCYQCVYLFKKYSASYDVIICSKKSLIIRVCKKLYDKRVHDDKRVRCTGTFGLLSRCLPCGIMWGQEPFCNSPKTAHYFTSELQRLETVFYVHPLAILLARWRWCILCFLSRGFYSTS